MGPKSFLSVIFCFAFFLLVAPKVAASEAEFLRQSLRELDLSGQSSKPKLSQVYGKVRDELPRVAQNWMDRVVENNKNEAIPNLESKFSQSLVRLNFSAAQEELVLEINLSSVDEPLKINGKPMPAKAWWSEKEFNRFLAQLPRKRAQVSKTRFFAELIFGEQAFAESINAKAQDSACKSMPAPKVCSEANPEFLKRYKAARKSLEAEMKQSPSLKLKLPAPQLPRREVANVAAPTNQVSNQRAVAAIVGMSLVWKSFYKVKTTANEAPVPMLARPESPR